MKTISYSYFLPLKIQLTIGSGREHEYKCGDSVDPLGSHDSDDSDDPGEEFDESELNKYDELEVINCHNDHERCKPILMLRESVKLFLHFLC